MPLYDAYGRPLPPNEPERSSGESPAHTQKWLERLRWLSKPPKKLWAAALAICGLASGLALAPRPTVAPSSDPADPTNALSLSFDVINVGYVPLRDVEVFLAIGQTGGKDAKPQAGIRPSVESMFRREWWQIHQLNMDDKLSIIIGQAITGEFAWGDIAIVVRYQPWIIPVKRKKAYRFVTYRERNGVLRWHSWPMDEDVKWALN